MCIPVVPQNEWDQWLQAFSRRHSGWLVTIETHDSKTGETVTSRLMRLSSVEMDREDAKNPRINIVVRDGNKEIKHILFRPSEIIEEISADGNEKGIRMIS